MRFLGLGLADADTVPDANTIWTFREALTRGRRSAASRQLRLCSSALTRRWRRPDFWQ
jgi:hypothetical protein